MGVIHFKNALWQFDGYIKTGYFQLSRCFKHIEGEQKKLLKIFLQIMMASLVGVIAVQIGNIWLPAAQSIFQGMVLLIIMAFLGKIVDVQIQLLSFMKFTGMDTARVRQSLTTGDLVQLEMRAVGKLEYMERRSMKIFARTSDFWRRSPWTCVP